VVVQPGNQVVHRSRPSSTRTPLVAGLGAAPVDQPSQNARYNKRKMDTYTAVYVASGLLQAKTNGGLPSLQLIGPSLDGPM